MTNTSNEYDNLSNNAFEAIIALNPMGRVAMTRDMELIRLILLEIKSWGDMRPRNIRIEGYDALKVFRHLEMLYDAKLIDVPDGIHRSSSSGDIDRILVTDMSWAGHDFIATLEHKGVWNKLKASFSPEQLAGMPFEVMKAVGIAALIKIAEGQLH